MRILLDTDIGDNIDDAYALALALVHPDIDLVGVTTVWGDTAGRARVARHLLDLFGRGDVPVYAGAGKPILGPDRGEASQTQLATIPSHVVAPSTVHAVDAMRNAYAQPDGDVVLVAIGPLTNLALALALDPMLAERIPHVYAIGGNIAQPVPEWNIGCDAVASAIVLRSGVPLTLIPFNITQHRLGPEHIAALDAAPGAAIERLMELTHVWHADTSSWPMLHAPLTVAAAVESAWIRAERVAVDVVLDGPRAGTTVVVPDREPNVAIATEVDGPAFAAWLTQTLATGAPPAPEEPAET